MCIRERRSPLAVIISLIICATGVWTSVAEDQDLHKRIMELEQRVAELSTKARMEPGQELTAMDRFWSNNRILGFVSTSYIYNFNNPRNDLVDGRSYDNHHDEFTLNKLKLTLRKDVEFSGDHWDAGYCADVIFGKDAQLGQSLNGDTTPPTTFDLGTYGDLEQLHVMVNVPVGSGLQVSMGKWVTLMGVEVVEETANPNWSEGNQFLFVENVASTGMQLSYNWTESVDTQFRVFNGWDLVRDNNSAKSYMGRIGVKCGEKTAISLVGYTGPEQFNDSEALRKGVNLIINRKVTDKLTSWVQLDYGHEDDVVFTTKLNDAEWWAAGLWLTYDFTDQVGLALRGDFLDDQDGVRTSGVPFTAPLPANSGQELSSVTATLNLKPVPNVQLRPELRWDHSTLGKAFDGAHNDQFTAGLGVAYLF